MNLRLELQALASVEAVEVSMLPVDGGRQWSITFPAHVGFVELMASNASMLTGTGADLVVSKVRLLLCVDVWMGE